MNKERAQEYKNETGKDYGFCSHKLQANDPKQSFLMRRISFEKYALNVRELVANYDNASINPEMNDFDELIKGFKTEKEKLTKGFWAFEKMNKVDPKGCIYDHMEWTSQVINTCNEYISYCKIQIKAQDSIQDWETKIGA